MQKEKGANVARLILATFCSSADFFYRLSRHCEMIYNLGKKSTTVATESFVNAKLFTARLQTSSENNLREMSESLAFATKEIKTAACLIYFWTPPPPEKRLLFSQLLGTWHPQRVKGQGHALLRKEKQKPRELVGVEA